MHKKACSLHLDVLINNPYSVQVNQASHVSLTRIWVWKVTQSKVARNTANNTIIFLIILDYFHTCMGSSDKEITNLWHWSWSLVDYLHCKCPSVLQSLEVFDAVTNYSVHMPKWNEMTGLPAAQTAELLFPRHVILHGLFQHIIVPVHDFGHNGWIVLIQT